MTQHMKTITLVSIVCMLIPNALLAQSVTESARKHIEHLCSPRMSGRGYVNNGAQIAADYIDSCFRSYDMGVWFMQDGAFSHIIPNFDYEKMKNLPVPEGHEPFWGDGRRHWLVPVSDFWIDTVKPFNVYEDYDPIGFDDDETSSSENNDDEENDDSEDEEYDEEEIDTNVSDIVFKDYFCQKNIYQDEFSYKVNVFPDKMNVTIDEAPLKPGVDFLVDAMSAGGSKTLKCVPFDKKDLHNICTGTNTTELKQKIQNSMLY